MERLLYWTWVVYNVATCILLYFIGEYPNCENTLWGWASCNESYKY